MNMQTFVLPNGLKIYAQSEIGASALYHEIFNSKTYLQHGIEVSDGDCVFDVGANVGLFSIFLSQSYGGLRLFAFEPIRQTFSLLEKNVGLHLNGSHAKLFNFGLSSRSGTALFEYDRFLSPAATMYPKEVNGCVRPDAGIRDWAKAGAVDLRRISKLSDRQAYLLLKALSMPVLGWLVAAVMIALLLGSIARKKIFLERPECQLRTVSEVIREHNIESIDLMKIDVEGSELDVISGIDPGDWPKIRQFVVEAHDIDGRVETMRSIFENHGYRTVVDQCEWETLKLINNFTIFAVR
jgi:FkbM family methyltransferase